MHNTFFKFFTIFLFSFATLNASGGSISTKELYNNSLKQEYEKIKPYKDLAKKRKSTYIMSAIVALLMFGLFAKFFGFSGVIVSLIMIGFGIYYLKSIKTSPVSEYETIYKTKLISPIGYHQSGFVYKNGNLTQDEFNATRLFEPKPKAYYSQDLYVKEDAQFSWVDVTFDTKQNASLEKFDENRFQGFIITINKPTASDGILISDALKSKVAQSDIEMNNFFANATRNGRKENFEVYGDVSEADVQKAMELGNELLAISFEKDKINIALYMMQNPLEASTFSEFDLSTALKYEKAFHQVETIVNVFK